MFWSFFKQRTVEDDEGYEHKQFIDWNGSV